MPMITQAEMDRRIRMAKAASAITEAMYGNTAGYGEMTTIEWLSVLSDTMSRLIKYELRDEAKPCP